jgi:large subunit ribosomal protein L15
VRLNSLTPKKGSKKDAKRRGRGHSAGQGKTAGRGQKGQHARAGGYTKVGFEGGQMPLQRRLPKRGFSSRTARYNDEVALYEIQVMKADVIDLSALKAENVVGHAARKVKIIKTGELKRVVTIKGLGVTKGAAAAIEAAGGKVE